MLNGKRPKSGIATKPSPLYNVICNHTAAPQYGAIRLSYNVTLTYEGTGKNEIATSITWECRENKAAQTRKFHGKYVLLTSLDESQELNIWKFYNVIRTVEETFHVLKTDLDIRPVYHKSDNGIIRI